VDARAGKIEKEVVFRKTCIWTTFLLHQGLGGRYVHLQSFGTGSVARALDIACDSKSSGTVTWYGNTDAAKPSGTVFAAQLSVNLN